jgi:hypothetical protein
VKSGVASQLTSPKSSKNFKNIPYQVSTAAKQKTSPELLRIINLNLLQIKLEKQMEIMQNREHEELRTKKQL